VFKCWKGFSAQASVERKTSAQAGTIPSTIFSPPVTPPSSRLCSGGADPRRAPRAPSRSRARPTLFFQLSPCVGGSFLGSSTGGGPSPPPAGSVVFPSASGAPLPSHFFYTSLIFYHNSKITRNIFLHLSGLAFPSFFLVFL